MFKWGIIATARSSRFLMFSNCWIHVLVLVLVTHMGRSTSFVKVRADAPPCSVSRLRFTRLNSILTADVAVLTSRLAQIRVRGYLSFNGVSH